MPAAVPTPSQGQIIVHDSGRPAANSLMVSDRIIIKSDCALWGLVAAAYEELFASGSGVSRSGSSTIRLVLSEEGDLNIPLRVVEPTGEYFSGSRGKLLVIKKQR